MTEQPTVEIALRPCLVSSPRMRRVWLEEQGRQGYWVECDGCGASSDTRHSERGAAKSWNTMEGQ
jgi:hypothetical protein